jgi:hypothetical protein
VTFGIFNNYGGCKDAASDYFGALKFGAIKLGLLEGRGEALPKNLYTP